MNVIIYSSVYYPVMELLQIFDNFKLDDLNDKWVNTVWDSQFLTYDEPPQDDYFLFIESEDMDLLLQDTCEVVKDWLAKIHTSEECNNKEANVSWDVLVSLNINVHALLSVLYYIIKSGQRDEANKTSKQTCLNATSLYLMLLAIPGSRAFNIFHPNLYKKAIESLKLCKLLIPIVTKGNKTVTLEYMDINEDQSSDHVISLSEKVLLIEGLKNILSNFITMIKLFSFRAYSHSLDITISVLLEVTDVNQFEYQKTRNKLFCNAYTALFKLCDNKHGPIKTTIMMIAKYIHPRFLFNHNDHQIKFMANMHELTIDFLRKLLHTYEKEAKIAIMTLIQYIMIKCPERQEARQKQATVLLKLITICKEDIIIHIINDIISLSHHTKVSCRLFAQEIIGKLLIESNLNNHDLIESLQRKKIKKALIATTLSRCVDSSNMVRGRAMATIAEFTDIQNNIIEMLVEDTSEVSCSDETLPLFDELRTILLRDVNQMPTLNTVLIMLIDRVEDERALVRRSALQILKNLTIKFPILTCQVAPIVGRRCRDPVMTVRRFAIHILSVILEYFPSDSQILNEWVETVLPQIFDTEIKVQEKALESFQDLLISKITNHSKYTDNAKSSLPWRIVDIQSHIGSDNDTSAWVLLTAISESMKLPNLNKYIDDYKDLIQKNNYHSNLILQILRNSWSSLSKNDMNDLYEYLYQCLCDFKIHFSLISICLDIIGGIIKHLHPDDNNHLVQSNTMKLMEISEIKIQKMLKTNNKTIMDTSNYIKAMSTLGHVAFSCTNKLSSSTLRILEGLLLESELLPDSIKEVKELQAFAVVVLGQHAIRDHEIAQEVIPILGRLLRMDINHNSSTEIAIKVNAAKALADLCIRFTTLVEPYLSDMCICMKDRSSIVREAVVVIFIQLLLEDFIKVKGPFFFHILTMLFDPDKMIRELTIFLIEERLLKKNKVLISQKFLESIYHYNNYQFKHRLCDRKMRKEEKEILTFPGNKNHDNRAIIYNFMIEHLDPPEKIKLLVKLTTQILGRVSNGTINVTSQKGACVLKDTLYILNNERLQPFLSSNKHTINSQDQEDFMSPSDVSTTNAITVIIEGMKRHGLDILLPTLLKVKEKLEILKSPLKHDVMRFVSRMYTIYSKEHLTNLLNEYPQLEKEIDQYKRNFDKDANMETDNVEIQDNLRSLKTGTENLKTNVQLSICTRIPKVILHRISPTSFKKSQESNPSTSTPKLSDRSYDHKRDYILPIKCTKRSSHSQETTLDRKVIKNSTVQILSDNDSE
ncbi:condensin-2 complex subunit D3-like isoform X3 [Vespula pensylvanica]|uniref:condensin-2 complex subunit D3-like isoform X3 n=1 Tax=Vespula pensylvanica TaxID=30213 RepID=UPI001CBA4DC0|nr:condensin-2 complex subunit D3-like isoform X3 [Vespula pensylvanica]